MKRRGFLTILVLIYLIMAFTLAYVAPLNPNVNHILINATVKNEKNQASNPIYIYLNASEGVYNFSSVQKNTHKPTMYLNIYCAPYFLNNGLSNNSSNSYNLFESWVYKDCENSSSPFSILVYNFSVTNLSSTNRNVQFTVPAGILKSGWYFIKINPLTVCGNRPSVIDLNLTNSVFSIV